MTASGELATKRKDQRVRWMWATVEDRITTDLRRDPTSSALIAELEAAVRDNTVAGDESRRSAGRRLPIGDAMTFSEFMDRASAIDSADPLAMFRGEFEMHDDHTLYLDGNSLGRMPKAARAALFNAIDAEWAGGLVESWEQWITLTRRAGDEVGQHLLCAPRGTTLIADSTSVNLFKLASAALDSLPLREAPSSPIDTTSQRIAI